MKNITGTPVEGDDFFERPGDLARLRRELENQGNVFITAPRRVGKTSLVLRLCELERHAGRSAVYLNVEGCPDELVFAERLVDALREAGLQPEALNRLGLAIQRARAALGGTKLGAAGVDLELDSDEAQELGTLGRALESIFKRLEKESRPLLLVLDEMPEHLLQLGKGEEGEHRAARLLHWLRSLRQTYRKHVRWIFLGSIGLDTFVEERLLGKAINDLTRMTIAVPTAEEADRFLERLGNSNGLPISPEARAYLVERIGWPLLHHLQAVFHALRDLEIEHVDEAAVDRALDELLKPHGLSQFDTWRQRLDEQFSVADAQMAKQVLSHLSLHPSGRGRDEILFELVAKRPNADSDQIDQDLARLLQILLRDGYLHESDGRYAFRSFLLREFWQRRHVR